MGQSPMSTSRNWLFTLNNPTEDPEEYLGAFFKKAKARFLIGQLERGENDTPHLQFALNMAEPCRQTKFKKQDKRLHIELVKRDNGIFDYCSKVDTRVAGPWEYGTRPIRANTKTDWDEVRTAA